MGHPHRVCTLRSVADAHRAATDRPRGASCQTDSLAVHALPQERGAVFGVLERAGLFRGRTCQPIIQRLGHVDINLGAKMAAR